MDFGVNQTVCLFDNFPKYDLKDCLIGDKRFEDVLCTSYKNLQLLKCNNVFFDYLKYKEEIKKIINNIEVDFDYIFIVGFNYDELKFEFRNSISTEIIFVADNSVQSICFIKNILKKCWAYNNIINKKIILNNHKVIAEINGKAISKTKLEEILKIDVLFVKGLLTLNKKIKKIEVELIADAIEENRPIVYDYKKYFKGITGFFRRKFYERFER